jgi:hypothetical protein
MCSNPEYTGTEGKCLKILNPLCKEHKHLNTMAGDRGADVDPLTNDSKFMGLNPEYTGIN